MAQTRGCHYHIGRQSQLTLLSPPQKKCKFFPLMVETALFRGGGWEGGNQSKAGLGNTALKMVKILTRNAYSTMSSEN